MRYTINEYSNMDALGNRAFVLGVPSGCGYVLTDHNGNTFHGDNHWVCIDKFLAYYGG